MHKTRIAAALLAALCLMTGCSGSQGSGQETGSTEQTETTELTEDQTTAGSGDVTAEADGREDGEPDEDADPDEVPEDGDADDEPELPDDGGDSDDGDEPADGALSTAPADPTKLSVTESNGYKDGFFYSEKLDEGVEVTADKAVSDAYMKKCSEAVINMPQTTLIAIWEGAKKTCLAFIEQERANLGDKFDEERTSPDIKEDTPSKEMAQYIRLGGMMIEKPTDENTVGFELNGSCEWDLEHGFEVVIVNDRVIYAGTCEQYSPWDTEYYTRGDGKEQNYAQ
ncbi:MAG: hypothetical protein J6Z45_00455 [Oscillospiraceae bacterium]|nr:hypothetical protein [Oscillospiraceae bacterium]